MQLCILVKVLMLMRVMAIALLSEILEDYETEDSSTFEISDHYMLSNISSHNVTVLNDTGILPSEPKFPMAFVDFDNKLNKKANISVIFKWEKPEFTNGVIKKYRVEYWFSKNLKTIININISATQVLLIYKAYNLKPNTTYYFRVQAHNEVGAGPYTDFINVFTDKNQTTLLLAFIWRIMLVQSLENFGSNKYEATEQNVTYSELERKLYWINRKSELMTNNFDPSAIDLNVTKITKLNASFTSNLHINWVTRNLYWTEYGPTNKIMKLDLALLQTGIVKYDNILERKNKFICLNVLPSIGYLYWLEQNSFHQYVIMQSDFNGKNVKPLLENNLCSCQYKKQLDSLKFIQVDNTNIDKPLMYWICTIESTDSLIVTDIYGSKKTHLNMFKK
ncbi:proto-oncogene tyrosine-protein kinase ROS-like [Anoplolepis gracilipes]|uniref:proto-oncogene tyrosine-protein kinase ROS-like n=1 Tax=Anoplolepis gracilipes TaxID=354296 RepID=UPI003B9F8798